MTTKTATQRLVLSIVAVLAIMAVTLVPAQTATAPAPTYTWAGDAANQPATVSTLAAKCLALCGPNTPIRIEPLHLPPRLKINSCFVVPVDGRIEVLMDLSFRSGFKIEPQRASDVADEILSDVAKGLGVDKQVLRQNWHVVISLDGKVVRERKAE